jgi:hypothetical protein
MGHEQPVSAHSNRVSGVRTRKLQIGDQRLAREIGWLRAKIQKYIPRRPRDLSLTLGNVARISANRTSLTETGLAGWACKIRTQKCRRKLSLPLRAAFAEDRKRGTDLGGLGMNGIGQGLRCSC